MTTKEISELAGILEKLFNGGVHKSLSGLADRDRYIQEATQAIKELYLSALPAKRPDKSRQTGFELLHAQNVAWNAAIDATKESLEKL